MADWSLWLLEWWEHWEHCPCHQKVIPNYQYSMLQYIITMHRVHAESTDFANNWSKAMLSIAPSPSKPFALKKVIKSIKLKVWTWQQHDIATTICFLQIIQDINSLKRLLKEAESSYYALYKLVMSLPVITPSHLTCLSLTRCFTFLQESGNKDVLLRCSYMEARTQNETATLEIIATLKEFFRRQTGTNTSSIGTGTNASSIGTLETSLIQFWIVKNCTLLT